MSQRSRLLAERYGDGALTPRPASITADRLEEKLAERDALDPHFAKASLLDFAAAGLTRTVLDRRTQQLVLIGQFTVTRSVRHLEDVLRAALEDGVPAREALEPILQAHVYAGEVAVDPALAIFARVAGELDALGSLEQDQLPVDGRDSERRLDVEAAAWDQEVADDPRRARFMEKYGWLGISTGLRYKGRQHLAILEYRDSLDPDWTALWLRFGYQNLYSRHVLDDRVRLLCAVGDCVALGEPIQAREHMQGSLTAGALPAEVMEVIQMSAVHFGFPKMGQGLRAFVALMTDLGRASEIGAPPVDPQTSTSARRA